MPPTNDKIFEGLAQVLASEMPDKTKLFFAELLTMSGFREGWVVWHPDWGTTAVREIVKPLLESGLVEILQGQDGLTGLGLGRDYYLQDVSVSACPDIDPDRRISSSFLGR